MLSAAERNRLYDPSQPIHEEPHISVEDLPLGPIEVRSYFLPESIPDWPAGDYWSYSFFTSACGVCSSCRFFGSGALCSHRERDWYSDRELVAAIAACDLDWERAHPHPITHQEGLT